MQCKKKSKAPVSPKYQAVNPEKKNGKKAKMQKE